MAALLTWVVLRAIKILVECLGMGPFYFSSIEIIIRACLKYAASGQSDLHFSIVSGGEHSVVHAQTTSLACVGYLACTCRISVSRTCLDNLKKQP